MGAGYRASIAVVWLVGCSCLWSAAGTVAAAAATVAGQQEGLARGGISSEPQGQLTPQQQGTGDSSAPAYNPADADDSVRCRMSGICDGGPPPGPCPANLSASYPYKDAVERDAALACVTDAAQRAQHVVEAASWSWKGYRECAWAWDELQPVSCTGVHWLNLSLTLVDSLDTLYLLGMEKEFVEAAEFVVHELDVTAPAAVNLFETTIRIVGGLLSAHYLSSDSHPELSAGLGAKATQLGERLLPAFTASPTGIPYSDVCLRTGTPSMPRWANISSLSEIATLSLEFSHLAHLTGRPEFEAAALNVHNNLAQFVGQYGGLLPLYFSPLTGRRAIGGAGGTAITLGARADSYYEYLLKHYLLSNRSQPELLSRYALAMRGVRRRLLHRTAPAAAGGLLYVGELKGHTGPHIPKMDHLVCFLPGLLALGDYHGVETLPPTTTTSSSTSSTSSSTSSTSKPDASSSKRDSSSTDSSSKPSGSTTHASSHGGSSAAQQTGGGSPPVTTTPDDQLSDLELAEELALTCYELYRRTPVGLAPEIVHFMSDMADYPGHHQTDVGQGHFTVKPADAHNLLRPETVESLYVLWKVTGRPRYRDWAWSIFRAFQRWARVEAMQQCQGGQAEPEAKGGAAGSSSQGSSQSSNSGSGSSGSGGNLGNLGRFKAGHLAAKGQQQSGQQPPPQQAREQAQEQGQGQGLGQGEEQGSSGHSGQCSWDPDATGREQRDGTAQENTRGSSSGSSSSDSKAAGSGTGASEGGSGEGQTGQQVNRSSSSSSGPAEGSGAPSLSAALGAAEAAVEAVLQDLQEQQQQQPQQQGRQGRQPQQQKPQRRRPPLVEQALAALQAAKAAASLEPAAGSSVADGSSDSSGSISGGSSSSDLGGAGSWEGGGGGGSWDTERACPGGQSLGGALRGGGFSSLESVLTLPPTRRDKMESFWMSETLKYLYLIFVEPPERCLDESCRGAGAAGTAGAAGAAGSGQRTLLPLDRFVFNTEAHPLPLLEMLGEAEEEDEEDDYLDEEEAGGEQQQRQQQAQHEEL